MSERNRVLDAFRNCITVPKCKDCPWTECSTLDNGCVEIPRDLALAVMRELVAQEARVMTLGEVRNWVNSDRVTREPVVIEIRGGVCAWIIDDEVREIPGEENLTSNLYGRTWRCWTSRPTKEQREAEPWQAPSTSDSAPNG